MGAPGLFPLRAAQARAVFLTAELVLVVRHLRGQQVREVPAVPAPVEPMEPETGAWMAIRQTRCHRVLRNETFSTPENVLNTSLDVLERVHSPGPPGADLKRTRPPNSAPASTRKRAAPLPSSPATKDLRPLPWNERPSESRGILLATIRIGTYGHGPGPEHYLLPPSATTGWQ